ncbi:MAG: tetratricopeptide repeat protein [Parahaliea sp.]
MKRPGPLGLAGLLSVWLLLQAAVPGAANLSIKLPQPEWILNTGTEPLREREAGLKPEEQKLAVELRPLVREGNYRAALERLNQADTATFSAALTFVQAQLYLSLGELPRARDAYLATLEKMPDFDRAHRALAAVYLQQGKQAQARKHLTRALVLGANDAQLYGQLAYLNLQERSPWSAISGYQQALFLDPDNPQWRRGLLLALVASRHFEAARALIEEALASDPDDAGLWLQYSNLALNTDDPTGALASLEMAARLGRLEPDNIMVLAQLHLQEGSLDRGVSLLRDNLERLDDHHAGNLVQTLQWLVQRDEAGAARQLIAGLGAPGIRLNQRERSQLLTAQGKLQQLAQQPERATGSLEQAIKLDPANGDALLALAEQLGKGNPYRASTLFERAAALPAYEERARLGRARLAVSQGDYPLALDNLLRAQQLNPHRANLAANIASLERMVALEQYQR